MRCNLTRITVFTAFLVGMLSWAAAARPTAAAADEPAHLVWAERLVTELAPERNAYAWSPTFVVWSEDHDGPARNRSVCSSFVSHDLERAYGFDEREIVARFGRANPKAKDYYAAIVAGRGFARIARVGDLAPGDIIAVRYPAGSRPTGHVMILASLPRPHRASEPVVEGTTQFEAAVIDSSHSYHGLRDTRYLGNGTHGRGVGRGTLRLYANPDGTIAGYTWSTRAKSPYFTQGEHELAVGRFLPGPFAGALPANDTVSEPDDADRENDTSDERE